MKKVLLLLANGFEAFEASVFADVIGWNKLEGDLNPAFPESVTIKISINPAKSMV